ncbi:MAG: hypothetical protein IJI10_02550 [Eubacterium sp.]|nr:hypothetical protein [Eubacterium sp.]
MMIMKSILKAFLKALFIRTIIAIVVFTMAYGMLAADTKAADFGPDPVASAGSIDNGMMREVFDAANEILAKIPANASERDKVRLFHDELCRRVRYDYTQSSPHMDDVYGALVLGVANSHGYADAFKFLCDSAGVFCLLVCSETNAWNLVELNGELSYFVDVCWDDTDTYDANGKEYISYDNYIVNKSDLEKNGREHVAAEGFDWYTGYYDPEVGFWERNDYKMSGFTYDGVYQAFKTQYELGRTLLEVRYDNQAAYKEACEQLTRNDMDMIWDILYGIGQVNGYEYVRWECNDDTMTFRVYLDF